MEECEAEQEPMVQGPARAAAGLDAPEERHCPGVGAVELAVAKVTGYNVCRIREMETDEIVKLLLERLVPRPEPRPEQ